MNRALSYICSQSDNDPIQLKLLKVKQNRVRTEQGPILIQANPNPHKRKRRQSLLNPLPPSMILDKKSKSAIKRMSLTEMREKPGVKTEDVREGKVEDFYDVPLDESLNSGYVSPKKTKKAGVLNFSSNKINSFNPNHYFDIKPFQELQETETDTQFSNKQMEDDQEINQIDLHHLTKQ